MKKWLLAQARNGMFLVAGILVISFSVNAAVVKLENLPTEATTAAGDELIITDVSQSNDTNKITLTNFFASVPVAIETSGDTAAGDDSALGYTATEGAILTGQGSTNDITLKNDADAAVLVVPTGTTNVDIVGVATAASFEPDGDTAAGDNAAIGYTATEGIVITGQGSTNDVTIKNDADAIVIAIPTGTTTPTIADDTTLTTGTIILADGGTVTQITNRSTAVTLNTHSGQITTDDTSLAAGAEVTFVVNDSIVTATDAIIVSISDSPDADSLLSVFVTDIGAGVFSVSYSNVSANADTGAVVINFVVLRGASS